MPKHLDLPASGQHSLPPDPKGTAGVFRRVGYQLEAALADIIDNSIDARASTVLVRLVRTKSEVLRILIVDDGSGMTEQRLDAVMRYGVQQDHDKRDLGKYGIGLKSASFSQCSSLTVVTRKDGHCTGRRWTLSSIADNWMVEIVEPAAAQRFAAQDWGPLSMKKSGTIVVWDELELKLTPGTAFERGVTGLIREITSGLGLTFHRFVAENKPKLFVDVQERPSGELTAPIPVRPSDPFGYPKTGRKGFPTEFKVEVGDLGTLRLRAHIWPAKSKDPNYKLGGGNVAGRQGFYFYRNGRLIQPGGWNKSLKSDHEPHLSLARVEIDMPPEFDSAFKLGIQKDSVEPPRAFLDALKDAYSGNMSFSQYLDSARDSYRNAKPDKETRYFAPGDGIPARASRHIEALLADEWEGTPERIAFRWAQLDDNAFFELDRDDLVVRLNSTFRDSITGGNNSKTDAAMLKLMLFFLCEEAFYKKRLSRVQQDRLDLLNASLLDVLAAIE
ncbi:MAG: ATP-binding protein [Gemmatimonadales bacterium]|nr:ATP-binding protein [Gemmatimonadales bacterium]